MIFPGEDGLVLVLVCICILLVGFSIVSFGRIVDGGISRMMLILQADAIADSVIKGSFDGELQNAHVLIGRDSFGEDPPGDGQVTIKRVFFDNRLRMVEVTVW